MWAIGLMSGTSMDGIDAALVETDGERIFRFGPFLTEPYAPGFRDRLRAILGERGGEEKIAAVEADLTAAHGRVVAALLTEAGLKPQAVGVIGFHGHTIAHRPARRHTRQIGDGAHLARLAARPVVNGFRLADVAAGGQGAPLVPLYHQALARDLERPLAVVNIGGVANLTWIGSGIGSGIGPGMGSGETLLAFDTGPGNALLDDWMLRHTGQAYDEGGRFAATGRIDRALVEQVLAAPYFTRRPPKSLDRDDFSAAAVAGLAPADGAATLTAITAAAIAAALDHVPSPPVRVLVTGGGRHNLFLMRLLGQEFTRRGLKHLVPAPVEAAGWRGDALEAEAFAYLAVRSLRGLSLTLPGTTGAPRPLGGGVLWQPPGGS